MISTLAQGLGRRVEQISDGVSEALFEPVIRLGVTGLARSGKTVFITSLVSNLLNPGRMPGLRVVVDGRLLASYLQPQPDMTVPRFDYEAHLAAMTGPEPTWPESTRVVSELRLSFRVQGAGMMAGLQGPRRLHLDIVDYPGEWLLDLGLLERSYAEWSADVLARLENREAAQDYRAQLVDVDGATKHDETQAQQLAAGFTTYLNAARDAGYYDCTPGRFLLPGDLAGSPVLTFAPIPPVNGARRGSLWREMERRYEAYKAQVVKPFFRDHFARIDRQVVLVDALGALHRGPQALEDMRLAMGEILGSFRPGRNAFLSRLLGARRVDRLLFAATKSDHLHHSQHPQLTALMEALVRDARDRARFAGAEVRALALASLRATAETTLKHGGQEIACVKGRLMETGRVAAFHAGLLPENPEGLLAEARAGAANWQGGAFQAQRFLPAPNSLRGGEGPPHIRLDQAAEFLIGDKW